MAQSKWNPDLDEDQGDENEENRLEQDPLWGGRDAVIFLIDATKNMFQKSDEAEEYFRLCLKCALSTQLNKIISSERDLVSVVFFGTEVTDNLNKFKHITVFQPLQQPNAEAIKHLEKMVDSETLLDFDKKYGHSDLYSLSDALWICQFMFSNCPVKLANKRILLFTSNDNPHCNSDQAQRQARKKAKDLFDTGIELDLLPLGKDFNVKTFYRELVYQQGQFSFDDDDDDNSGLVMNPSEKLEELQCRVRKRDHKNRSIAKLSFALGNEVKIGVGLYNLVRAAYKPSKVKLDPATNEELKSSVKNYHAESGELLMPADILKYQDFGGKRITMTSDEVRSFATLYEPGLKLLGFKPRSCVKIETFYKPMSFLYPTEKLVKGSRMLFAALHQRCLKREVVPICRFVPRRTSGPRIVALIPQPEERDEDDEQTVPPGFHVYIFPYADDIRNVPLESLARATPEQVEAAKNVVKKFRIKSFDPQCFDNPVLKTHWRNVEVLALERDCLDEIEDHAMPNRAEMDKRMGSLADEFVKMVYPSGYNPDYQKPAAKRGFGGGDGDNKPAKKAPKQEAPDSGEVERLAKNGMIKNMKVDDLKNFLQSVGKRITGKKKAELVEDVYLHFGMS